LDPAGGAEVLKKRSCIVVSRREAKDISSTVTVAPLSSVSGRAADRLVQLPAGTGNLVAEGLPNALSAPSTNDGFKGPSESYPLR
jgi:mRNA-degrading endonuclease toxin of MazEF toxin-antitoxin module